MEDFCVSHNYTQRDLLLPLLPTILLPVPPSSTSTNWYFKRCISNVAVWKSTGNVRENEMFYNVKQVTLHFKRCGLKKYGKNVAHNADVLESTSGAYIGKVQGNPTCDVISAEKALLERILRNFWLRMRAPFQGTPFGVKSLPVAMSVMRNGTFCTTLVRKNLAGNGCACVHDHFRDFRFRSRDFWWRHFR